MSNRCNTPGNPSLCVTSSDDALGLMKKRHQGSCFCLHYAILIRSLTSDLDPTRKEDRKWNVWSLIAYWFSDAFNPAIWESASSILAVGRSYRDAIGIVAVDFFAISIVISLSGAIGVSYHAPFLVLARVSWGFVWFVMIRLFSGSQLISEVAIISRVISGSSQTCFILVNSPES